MAAAAAAVAARSALHDEALRRLTERSIISEGKEAEGGEGREGEAGDDRAMARALLMLLRVSGVQYTFTKEVEPYRDTLG